MGGRLGVWLAVAVATALVAAAAASAGPPGRWTRVTETNLVNFAEPAMARTGDGVLHAVYHHPTGPLSEELVHIGITRAGAPAGDRTVVAPAWATLNQRPALVRTPEGGLRLFFAGLHSTVTGDPLNEDMLTIASGADGRSWSAPQLVGLGNAPSYGSLGIAAAVAGDGTFVVAEADPGNLFHFGIGGGPNFAYESACCVYDPGIGVDAVTGGVVLGWFSLVNGATGLYTQTISPSGLVGARSAVPGSATADRRSANQPIQRTPLTGRIGAPGVYLAYGAGYPSFGTVNLLRAGGSPQVIARAAGATNVNLAAAPEGRLWLMWQVGNRYVATRSNRAATRFGPPTVLSAPPGTVSTFGLWGEGSLGTLDLLAHPGTVANGVAFWHTQVLPRLDVSAPRSVSVGAAATAKVGVTVKVTDAGDPVPGARVSFAGQTKTTNRQGVAVFTARRGGRFTAAAQRPGYRRDTTAVTVRKKKRG
jgi:hypothetical protein